MHYYKFHIGDYRRDTAHLSLLEHGVYRQLLDWLYLDQNPLPEDVNSICRKLCAKTDEEIAAVLVILKEMFTLTEDGYVQLRVLKEVSEYREKSKSASESAKARWAKENAKAMRTHNEGIPNVVQTHTDGNANHKPLTNNLNISTLSDKSDLHNKSLEILEHLNQKTGRKFKAVKANINIITARLKEFSFEELIAVVDSKCLEWSRDEKMHQYLRPETLFGATKCAGYVGSLGSKVVKPTGLPFYQPSENKPPAKRASSVNKSLVASLVAKKDSEKKAA